MQELWVDKHRPSEIIDYVFKDENQQKQVESWLKSGTLPHIILSGSAGIGKSTLIKVLLKELDVDPSNVLEINASKDNGVDFIRDTIYEFISRGAFGMKYVFLDEADYLSPNAQAVLRGMLEGDFSKHSRFLMTCNYPNKILPALHSRCQGFHIEKLDKKDFLARVAQILVTEGIEFDIKDFRTYDKTYPDMRKCINLMQMNSHDGKLMPLESDVDNVQDYQTDAVKLIKQGKYKQARELICSQIRNEDYVNMYRFLYENMDIWGFSESQMEKGIIVIKEGLVNHTLIGDPEINLSACLVQLKMLYDE